MDNPGLPPQTSNSYCLPGRAGGTPVGIRIRLAITILNAGAMAFYNNFASRLAASKVPLANRIHIAMRW